MSYGFLVQSSWFKVFKAQSTSSEFRGLSSVFRIPSSLFPSVSTAEIAEISSRELIPIKAADGLID